MSFFDPYHVSEYTGYYTKKGQVIQKRHVDRDYPLSERDKEKAIKVINAFGFKAVPYSYMTTERYAYFEGRTLSYEDLEALSAGSSFQIKLGNMYSFLPDLPIFNQVSSENVEEFNINGIVTSIWFKSNTDPIDSEIKVDVGEGLTKFSTNLNQISRDLRLVLSPNIDDGFVNRSVFSGLTVGNYSPMSVPRAVKGQLQEYLITADKYLYDMVRRNDFSDQRFNANVLEITNNGTAEGDIVNLTEIGIFFSVNVEVLYKSYLD